MSCMLPYMIVHHVSSLPCSISLLSQVIKFASMQYCGQYAAPLIGMHGAYSLLATCLGFPTLALPAKFCGVISIIFIDVIRSKMGCSMWFNTKF